MLYVRHTPRPPLHAFVERLWLVEGGHTARRDCILPNGTVELVVNLRDDRVQIDGTVHGGGARAVAGAAVSGPYSEAFIVSARQHAAMIGVHFRPGGAPAVLGVPAAALADAHVDLASLWGEMFVGELRERLCTAPTYGQRFRILEAVLTARLTSSRLRPHAAVLGALACASTAPTPVRALARDTGLSYRRFLTLFTRDVGITPKLFLRIRRFQRVHAVATRTGQVDWADVALQCGFCDQSHLVREFRQLSGLAPSQYASAIRVRRNLLDGHVALP